MSAEKWHGTPGGYTNHDCRCGECRSAWASYNKAYRHRVRERIAAGQGIILAGKTDGPGGIGSASRDLSRTTSTAVTGGDGPMLHPTHQPLDATPRTRT